MATRTPNYGLSKPLGTEDAQISVINANMDILDTELHLTTVRGAKNLAPIYDATSSYVEGDYVTYLITGQSSQDANGYFVFKCIDDTTTPAGNFDTTKWEAVCITDEMGSSGGSGGHTILDYDGTALQQEDNMQFAGTYSEDDSVNDKTVVHISRTMSKAQFNSLSEDEKKGIIATNDELPDDDTYFYPVIYSTAERQIGVWTDGKPLYQKTLTGTMPVVTDGTMSSLTISIAGLDVETVADYNIVARQVSGTSLIGYVKLTYITNSGSQFKGFVDVPNEYVSVSSNVSAYSNATVNVTLLYTKTTDVAGSGDWTPQGTPAVHYSTDEKVIGTWIDGSTIYERTVHFSSLQQLVANGWTNDIMDISYTDLLIDAEVIRTIGAISTYHYIQTAKNGTTGMFNIFNARNLMVEYDTITLRYTKSSS